jgi:hypothetical protein
MTNDQPDANSRRKRVRHWHPDPESMGAAAAAAASGDPSALLAVGADKLHDGRSQDADEPARRDDEAPQKHK